MELEFDILAHPESFFFSFFFAQWDHQLLECQDHLHYRALKLAFCLSDLHQLVIRAPSTSRDESNEGTQAHTTFIQTAWKAVLFSSSLDSGNYPEVTLVSLSAARQPRPLNIWKLCANTMDIQTSSVMSMLHCTAVLELNEYYCLLGAV